MKRKTFLTESYVNAQASKSGVNHNDWLLDRQREFEFQTGVKWSVSHQHGGYQFDPVDDWCKISECKIDVEDEIRRVFYSIKGRFPLYVTYLEVAEKSTKSLKDIMMTVYQMERNGKALRMVNRMGKGYAFKLRETGDAFMSPLVSQTR